MSTPAPRCNSRTNSNTNYFTKPTIDENPTYNSISRFGCHGKRENVHLVIYYLYSVLPLRQERERRKRNDPVIIIYYPSKSRMIHGINGYHLRDILLYIKNLTNEEPRLYFYHSLYGSLLVHFSNFLFRTLTLPFLAFWVRSKVTTKLILTRVGSSRFITQVHQIKSTPFEFEAAPLKRC